MAYRRSPTRRSRSVRTTRRSPARRTGRYTARRAAPRRTAGRAAARGGVLRIVVENKPAPSIPRELVGTMVSPGTRKAAL